ncbi:xanthine dehydrogenase family protein subunit M [Streptomyces sp. ME03-5709C]|nr:xanthine dehydrogenase family protein subunit M [Streptomyces sp. ME03-5709C]
MQIPASFEYQRAQTVEEALELLGRFGEEARVLAGGHSLLRMMRLRSASPQLLVDINDLTELDHIEEVDGELRVGALTRHRSLLESSLVGRSLPIVHDAERVLTDPTLRSRGTIGGSLCQADPAEDLPAVCAALRAVAVIRGAGGERAVAMADFHRGPFRTAVGPGELLTEVRFPVRRGSGSAYEKLVEAAGGRAVAAAGVALCLDDGLMTHVGVGLAGVGAAGQHAEAVRELLEGREPSRALFEEAGRVASASCSPVTDACGTADRKRRLAGELTERALRRAVARAAAPVEEG